VPAETEAGERRVALVMGGSRGIGLAIAERLGRDGVRLAVASRRPEDAVKSMAESGLEAIAAPVDLTNGDPEAGADAALRQWGRLDICVYAAGANVRKPATEITVEEWRTVHRLNLEAAWLTAVACAPAMRERGWGRILFISSIQAFLGGYDFGVRKLPMAAYSSSKAGLLGLMRSLSREWAPFGIRVNALAPGFTRTELTEPMHGDDALNRAITARIPIGRWAEPADMAGIGAWLCSEEADYITGQALAADGGYLS